MEHVKQRDDIYKVQFFDGTTIEDVDWISDRLNELAQAGWRVDKMIDFRTYLLKRDVPKFYIREIEK